MQTLKLTGKEIDLSASKLLYEESFSSPALAAWQPVGPVEWRCENGSLLGGSPQEKNHGQLFLKQAFAGDVLLDFRAATVSPSTHDLIWWWRTALTGTAPGWGEGYLGALGGWFGNRAGIERAPKFELSATTPLFPLEPGREYHIQSGSLGGHCFLFADGELLLEMHDPTPPADQPGHVGLGVYQSQARYRDFKVFAPAARVVKTSYAPE